VRGKKDGPSKLKRKRPPYRHDALLREPPPDLNDYAEKGAKVTFKSIRTREKNIAPSYDTLRRTTVPGVLREDRLRAGLEVEDVAHPASNQPGSECGEGRRELVLLT
jgi:hypothetical protein